MKKQECVLIVEDSPTQAEKLKGMLEKKGYAVSLTATGEEALKKLEEELPLLVIVDNYLPGIQGQEFCRRLRMNVNTRHISILMFTTDAAEAMELKSLESGADDYLPKSADPDILLARVQTLVRKGKEIDPIAGLTNFQSKDVRLLAVDDSPTYLEKLRQELQSEGYQFETAVSAQEALTKLSERNYDCILVDLIMPEVDGIELCMRLQSLKPFMKRPIVVLMLTAKEDKEALTRALEAGADDFVGKSSDMAVLKGRIRALLRRKFFEEQNRKILEELKSKEIEAEKARLEKKLAEQKAALATELERSNKDLEQFAYVASHDLQEPLRTVSSFVGIIADRFKGELDEETELHMKIVVEGARRMRQMIDDLLHYSKVGTKEKRFLRINCEEVLQTATENLKMAIEEIGVEIVKTPLPQIIGDMAQLISLFQNLLGNAIKFHGTEKPRIRVSATKVEGSVFWRFAVQDNGLGIEPKFHEKIFVLFQRLHGRQDYPGTGIGLSVCKKIVERHGGRIWVESEPGKGTTFFFTLSAAE